MIAFIGLGNIGSSYVNTKHNAGFWAIDHYSYRNSMAFQSGDGEYVFSKNKRDQVLLVKPTTMMNKSGFAVKDVMFRWGLLPTQIVVVLDDVDLPLGTIRIRPKGGDGCHGGLRNIIYHLKTDLFPRIRLGIAEVSEEIRPSEKYVLKPFKKRSKKQVEFMINRCAEAMHCLASHDLNRAMGTYNS